MAITKKEVYGIIEAHRTLALKDVEEKFLKRLNKERIAIVEDNLTYSEIEEVADFADKLIRRVRVADILDKLSIHHGRDTIADLHYYSLDRVKDVDSYVQHLASIINISVYPDLRQINYELGVERSKIVNEYEKLEKMLKQTTAKEMHTILQEAGFNMELTTFKKPKKFEVSLTELDRKALGLGG